LKPPDQQEDAEADATDERNDGEDATTLLDSPLGRGVLGRLFVLGGPLGLAIAIVLSLWVSYMHVRHTLVVQVETQWRVGERLAVRAHIVAERPGPITAARGRAWVAQGERSHPLGELESAAGTGVVQATFRVPELEVGPAELHLELEADEVEPMHEVLPISIVERRERRVPVPMIAGSTLQHGDDTDPQPDDVRIVVRPFGRILAGFDNTMMVRVTDPEGRPHQGRIEIVLESGEFMQARGGTILHHGPTDRLGFVFLDGLLTSDVLRLEIRVLDTDRPQQHVRRVRMVSYAGAVVVEPSTLVLEHGSTDEASRTLELHAFGLSAKLPVFVDVYGPDGGFIDVLPPFVRREPPRDWTLPAVDAGVVQIEAYHFTKEPGESTAVARLQVVEGPRERASLAPLVEQHREQMGIARVESGFDPALERAHLDWLLTAELDENEVEAARRWLLGTLPVTVYGPPTALVTHERDIAALTQTQRQWTIGLRIFLLGGGGLFLFMMTWAMVRAHGRAAATTLKELERLTEGTAREQAWKHVRRARRAAFVRGLGVVAVMAAGLVLTTIMLESLLWVF
jgi:hypothetical protein